MRAMEAAFLQDFGFVCEQIDVLLAALRAIDDWQVAM